LRNPHAWFCRGIIFDYMGLTRRAHAEFRAVVESDPSDAHAWYMLGSTMVEPEPGFVEKAKEREGIDVEAIQRKLNEQASYCQKALQCNPYLSAAVYKLALVQRFGGDRVATKRLIDHWKRLDGGPGGIRVGEETSNSYGDQGHYAQVINPF